MASRIYNIGGRTVTIHYPKGMKVTATSDRDGWELVVAPASPKARHEGEGGQP